MIEIQWSEEKNEQLQKGRGVSFDQVEKLIKQGEVIWDKKHPNQIKYPGQRRLLLKLNNYTYIIPYVEDEHKIFLKTIIPSRKEHKKYV